MLLGQLMQVDERHGSGARAATTRGSSDAAADMYKQMLPDQLADSLIAGGGTGLAREPLRAMQEGQS